MERIQEQRAHVLRLYREWRDWGSIYDRVRGGHDAALRAALESAWQDFEAALTRLTEEQQLLVNVLAGDEG